MGMDRGMDGPEVHPCCLLPFAGLSLPFLFQPLHTLVPEHILVGGDCCVVVLGCDGL